MADNRKNLELYAFPAIFEADVEDGGQICVSFPDLPSCFSNGKTVAEALTEATEALENVLYWMENDGNPIPEPSDIRSIHCSGNQFTSLIVTDMAAARRAWDNRSVSRTVTMPAWLDELARKEEINVSQILQQSIKKLLGVNQSAKLA